MTQEEYREAHLDFQLLLCYLRVTIGHLRVTVGHPRVTIGHLSVTMGHLRLTIGYHKALHKGKIRSP